ncbi:histone H4 transcription factor-like [Ornithodoros turicata]|uniref:histone H4 transcription factor-like n=1 Tax=Ornithodoros turicata TaxID=34597 RepID=UPI0031393428
MAYSKDVCVSNDEVSLQCEWDNCEHVSNDGSEYYMHVNEHLKVVQYTDRCLWRDCCASVGAQLKQHVLFHAFHCKLKCNGRNWIQKTGAKSCLLDKQTRNVVPDLPEKFICQWEGCDDDTEFHNPECYYVHVSIHAETKGIQCKWKGCDVELRGAPKLREHLRSHTQEKRVACPTCGGLFVSRTKLGDHLSRQLPPAAELSCSYCRRGFSSERLLRDHMRHHINHYKCPKCDMTCPSPSALKYHIQCRHTQLRPFVCQLCDYSTKLVGDFRKHHELHHSEEVKQCQSCQYVASNASELRKHLRSVHTVDAERSVYACHLCSKQYSKGHTLSRHLVSQHHFQWPSGHKRFTYCRGKDNVFTLQTVRYESLELTEGVVRDDGPAVEEREMETVS